MRCSKSRRWRILPAGGYVQLLADELPGPNHLDFKLPAEGGAIMLYDAFGAEINRVTYGPQLDGISQGRLPDGGANSRELSRQRQPGHDQLCGFVTLGCGSTS